MRVEDNERHSYTYDSPDSSPRRRDFVYVRSADDHDSLSISTQATTPTPIASRRNAEYPESKRRWAVCLYFLTTALLFADQNLLAPNLSAVANEFGFDDDERDKKLGGHIALAFWLLGAPASFLVGCLADTLPRAPLFAITVWIGEGSCLATYFTTTYKGLFFTRALTGVSLGGALPLIASVLGDMYEAKDRSFVMAGVGIGSGVGIAFGQGCAGFVGPWLGWRVPFLVVSVPAIFCALLVLLTVQDPERGSQEEVYLQMNSRFELDSYANENDADRTPGTTIDYESETSKRVPLSIEEDPFQEDNIDERSFSSSGLSLSPSMCERLCFSLLHFCRCQSWKAHFMTLKMLLRCKSIIVILFQGAPGCLPWGVVNSFLNDYLSSNRGMSVEKATSVILVFGIGNGLGLVVGGAAGNILYRKSPKIPPMFAGAMAIIGCFPMWLMINFVDDFTPTILVALISSVAGLCSGVTGPIVKSTLQNVTLPNTRGSAFSLQTIFDDIGRGLGPVFVSMLITSLGGRAIAFNISVFGWVLCGIFNCLLYFTVAKDEANVQCKFAESLHSNRVRHPITTSTHEEDNTFDPLICTKRNSGANLGVV